MPALSRAAMAKCGFPHLWKQHFAEKFAVIGFSSALCAGIRIFLGRSPSGSSCLQQGRRSSKCPVLADFVEKLLAVSDT
jgi:hypothetical protein